MSGRYIKLENLLNENVVIEDENAFEDSIYASVYSKADLLWEKIREENLSERKPENEKGKKIEDQTNNTISFEGRRGTGKTSAMLSFSKKLQKDKRNVVLDYIDACTMEEGEDIITLVLANMYTKFTDKDKEFRRNAEADYKSRDVYGAFEKVVDQLYSIKRVRKGMEEESSLRILDRLSGSQQLQKSMKDLIEKYLDYMAEEQSKDNPAMLVVAIDDIDMHFQGKNTSAFDILESLHRYLMIPGVVILLTFDYPELAQGCKKRFIQMYHAETMESSTYIDAEHFHTDNRQANIHGNIEIGRRKTRELGINEDYRRRQIKKVTDAYLEKILPAYTRIHMPSQKKRDYAGLNNTIIRVGEGKKKIEQVFERFQLKGKNTEKLENMNIKEFVFRLKAATVDLFYDGKGLKRHFAEPSNLRELVHVYTLFEQLQTIEKLSEEKDEKDRSERQEEENNSGDEVVFKELLDDLYFRYARVNLSEGEYERFNRYLEVPIERRSQDILREIGREVDSDSYRDNFSQSVHGVSQVRYVPGNNGASSEELLNSYGELIHGLYYASDAGIYSKPLICCLLDSYTIVLTRMYRGIKRGEETAIKRFKDVLGSSVSSSWSNRLVPEVSRATEQRDMTANHDYDTRYSRPVKVGAVRVINPLRTEAKKEWRVTSIWDDELPKEDRLQLLEIMCMFFTSVKNGENEWFSVTVASIPQEDINRVAGIDDSALNTKNKAVKFEFTEGCFNVMNFVTNLFDGTSFFDAIYKNGDLTNVIKQLIGTEGNISNFIKENSLRKGFEEWEKKSYGFAMPLYSLDVMYNIMKRQYLNHRGDVYPVDAKEFIAELKKVYQEIGELLKEEDEFYYGIKFEENSSNQKAFYTLYNESPFIKFFNKIEKGSKKEECLTQMIDHISTW